MLRSTLRRLPLIGRVLPRPFESPRVFPTEGFALTDKDESLEDERLAHYDPTHFYAAQLGEVFQSRYQVLGKLGYGAHSIAWLCRDLEYVNQRQNKSSILLTPE